MSKKKKIIVLLILLIVLILICKNILTFDSINYKINIEGTKIRIKEKISVDNYYIEIKTKDYVYPIRIYEDLKGKRKVVKDIYFYKNNNIECILPVINEKVYTDMLCYDDGILYDYSSLKSNDEALNKYIQSIKQYNSNNYKNIEKDIKNIKTIKYNIYNNLKRNVTITTYNGLLINTKEVKLFEKDIYNNKISTFIDKYYIIADYEQKYTFNSFYIVNLITKKIGKIESKFDISYDSYIQGIVDNKIYLYDKDNENQYEINIVDNNIKLVSNDNHIKYYNNKKWERINKIKANKEMYFNYESLDNKFPSYDYVKETNTNYYLFKKDGISYKLYRADKSKKDILKYIIDVPTTNVYFKDNYLYYIYKNKLFYYSDSTGFKTILENSELEFNDTIKYYIY